MPFTSLSPDEWKMACHVALDRQVSAAKLHLKDSVNKKKHWLDDLQFHVMGAVGEIAVAKVLGVQWNGSVDTFKSVADVGSVEVRFRSNPAWQLIVRDNDNNDAKFVLVRGLPPGAVEVVGWMYGRDAKNPSFTQDLGNKGRPAYVVPDKELRDMGEIK